MPSLNLHLGGLALYCAGLVTPFALVLFALAVAPVLDWLDRVDTRVRRWLDHDDQDVDEPPIVELDPIVDETVRMSRAWDTALRELTARRKHHGEHRA